MGNENRITEDTIRAKTTDKSFERGVDYLDWGMVERVTQRGNRLFAEVLGSECAAYRIGVTLQDDDFKAACTCPYDWGGYCKHIVAALLTFVRDDFWVDSRAPIEALLSELNAADLKALIIRIVDENPNIADVIDSFCGGPESPSEH